MKSSLLRFALIGVCSLVLARAGMSQGQLAIDSRGGSAGFGQVFNTDTITPLIGATFSFNVLGSTNIGGPFVIVDTANSFPPPLAMAPGNVYDGNTIPTGIENAPYFYVVQAWDNTTGVDFASATTRGESAITQIASLQGFPGSSPINNFMNFSLAIVVVPEPATVALGALGAVALVIRRRKV